MNEQVPKAKVIVLMATCNGMAWLPEQVDSILAQRNVDVQLVVSDDASDDGSWEWLENKAAVDARINLLKRQKASGSAGRNFYRLIKDVDIANADYIAFADQDDIWLSRKLADQVCCLVKYGAYGASSNVVAFWANGSRCLVNKAALLRKVDFLFESSGPGCSFIVRPDLLLDVRKVLNCTPDYDLPILHDWLIYAVCRASNKGWYISPRPLLQYRQHENNVIGANYGFTARIERFKYVKSRWYRHEVQKIARIALKISNDPYVLSVCEKLIRLSIQDRVNLLLEMKEARRERLERLMLAVMTMSFIF